MARGREKLSPPPLPSDMIGQDLGKAYHPLPEKKKVHVNRVSQKEFQIEAQAEYSGSLHEENAAYFDSPVTELKYVTEKLRLAEDNLAQEREMREVAEENLQRLASDAAMPLAYEPGDDGSSLLDSPSKGSPRGSPTKRGSPSKGAMATREMEAQVAIEGRAREEKWATIARMNKRKVVDLENQARGDERRILRLERALETERQQRVELEDALAEILANGEDMMDMLKRTSTYSGSQAGEMQKTYGQVRGVLRSPNKTTTEKGLSMSQAVHKLYSQVMMETEARLSNLQTGLVAEQRRSRQLEENLKQRLADLDKARVLFRQIMRLLPTQSRDKIRHHLDQPSPKPSPKASPSPTMPSKSIDKSVSPVAGVAELGNMTAEEAKQIGEANNYNARAPVAMSFTNDSFLSEVDRKAPEKASPEEPKPVVQAPKADLQVLDEEGRFSRENQRTSFLDRISAAINEIGSDNRTEGIWAATARQGKEGTIKAVKEAGRAKAEREKAEREKAEREKAEAMEASPPSDFAVSQRDRDPQPYSSLHTSSVLEGTRELTVAEVRETTVSEEVAVSSHELARNSPTLATAQAKANALMLAETSADTEEVRYGTGPYSQRMKGDIVEVHAASGVSAGMGVSAPSKWDALSQSASLLPRLTPDRDAMKERMLQKFEERMKRDHGLDERTLHPES